MPKPKKTRRGGVKHRARRLYKQLIAKPANLPIDSLLGIEDDQFQINTAKLQDQPSLPVAWPDHLVPIFIPPISPVALSQFSSLDPRLRLYSTRRKPRTFFCEYCDAYKQKASSPGNPDIRFYNSN